MIGHDRSSSDTIVRNHTRQSVLQFHESNAIGGNYAFSFALNNDGTIRAI